MDWVLFFSALGAIATVVALIAVPYTIVGYFKSHPKRQLLYSVTSRPLITNAAIKSVKVTVEGETIDDPHFVELRLTSTSRADIPSSLFDSGSPIDISLGPHSVVVSQSEHGIEITSWEADWLDILTAHIDPQLIKRGATLAIDFVTQGEPDLEVRAPLIDVRIKQASDRRALQAFTGELLDAVIPFSSIRKAIGRMSETNR
ncbi:hypothetical protein LJR186_001198 [Microbacterium foliorum]